ncbi:MAG TPA: c-type cytochrome domain-containing protein [Flavipsychrobacter sp.]
MPKTGIDPAATQYPLEVANIIVNKCATAGCHNEASYTGAGGLRLDDWQYMFDGGSNGAVAVPYSPENSSLLYFLNPGSYDNISVKPTMPYNMPPLSKEEYDLIKKWVADGAPDKNGNIPFGSNAATRQKAYLAQQGCDLVGVIDAEKKVIMRYIKTGQAPNVIESPHYIQTDSKGEYAYVCFIAGSVIQKIDMRTDKVVGQADLSLINGGLNFNIVQVSEAGDKLVASQLTSNGGLVIINTADMKLEANLAFLESPHGIAANSTFDTFYVTAQYGNTVYKVVRGTAPVKISIDGMPSKTTPGANTPDPHEIIMSPDNSKYFLTCQNTNDVRVMNRANDSLLKVIPTGIMPLEVATSVTKPYLFVTCMEDVSQVSSLFRGSVLVINYNTLEVVKRIDGTFYQPHGIAVDDRNGTFYIASRNVRSDGPAPHHTSDCGGRNGYYQVYDLNTLAPLNGRRYEVTPDPYSINMRFK